MVFSASRPLGLLLFLATSAVAYYEGHGFCRDLTCASKERLLESVMELQKEVSLKSALLSESNCTACYSSPCLNGGTCEASAVDKTGYTCRCPGDKAGDHCEKTVTCDGKCGINTDCFVANHQANCACKFGYSGNPLTGCQFRSKKICVTGDPHYITFDGTSYDFQSTCPYIFSEPCTGNLSGGYDYFSVKAKNEILRVGDQYSDVQSAEVVMHDQKIYVNRMLQVFINNEQVHVPFYYPSASAPRITISLNGHSIIIKNDQFVEVTFTPSRLCLTVPDVAALQGKNTLCGLAGNLDSKCDDDFIQADGTVIPLPTVRGSCRPTQSQVDDFADTWRTTQYTNWGPTDACADGHIMTNTSKNCDMNSAVAQCQDIYNAQLGKGPLAGCSAMGADTIQRYYDNCLYDVCRNKDKRCDSMVDFVHTCQAQLPKVDITGWRDAVGCPIMCAPHSSYSTCPSACPATCAKHDAPEDCDSGCTEGCACDAGYVLDTTEPLNVHCIRVQECGCNDDLGNFHPPDQPWMTNSCTQDNVCSNGTYLHTPWKCSPHGHCALDAGVYDCECNTGFQGDGTNCEDIDECEDGNMCGANSGHGTCVNTIGSYYCECAQFWEGGNCGDYKPARHCADLRVYHGKDKDGVYKVQPPIPNAAQIEVYCDMTSDGGGWMLMGNSLKDEMSGKKMAEYVAGFGNPADKDAWLGLDRIHAYTNYQNSSLRLNIFRCARKHHEAKWTECTYDKFEVDGPKEGYRVTIPEECYGTEDERYDGWARWKLSEAGPKFVAIDNDDSDAKCSSTFRNTGFWFDTTARCGYANLNGVRFTCENEPTGDLVQQYLHWNGNPINKAEMYLRPREFPNYDPQH